MPGRTPQGSPESGDYRTRYLRLKSVLFDRTTGLPAFPVLFDRLRGLLEHHARLGVMLVSIEPVDLVESIYGWQVLDRILGRVSAELEATLGRDLPAATLLAVSGVAGERFAAFLPEGPDGGEVDTATMEEACRAVRRRVDAVFDGEDFTSLSPRLSVRTGHAMLATNPFYRFERQVYAAIEEARLYDDRRQRRREHSWSEALQKIIEDRDVKTVFQPVVELETGAILGHEALARGPKDSPFERPLAMFALSQRIGLSSELDRICRDSALRASAAMVGAGKLFLNVLPASVEGWERNGSGPDPLLEATAIDRGEVVLEFSDRETSGVEDFETLVATLLRLKERGFRIALDDVGTGYASQAILERVRPDYLKLDVSLVRNVHRNLIKQEMLHSLVRIARNIDAKVIAEGIETSEEASALRESGADYGQGFYFAAPAPASPGPGGH